MYDFKSIAIFVVFGTIAFVAMRFFATLLPILRSSYWPATFTPLNATPKLNPGQQDLVDELQTLAFSPVSFYRTESAGNRYDGLLLQRPEGDAFAFLAFAMSFDTGYLLEFMSFTRDGKTLLTVNRKPLVLVERSKDVIAIDALAPSLTAHWQFHKARRESAELRLADAEEAVRTLKDLTENALPLLIKSRSVVKGRNGNWHPALLAALRMNARLWRNRAQLKKPYQSTLMSGPHRSELFARGYELYEKANANRPPRNSVTAGVLILSLAASLAIWANVFDWNYALILVAVLLVHETGHALAMRAFGYRDISMFFIPFFGAAVTGTAKEMPAWKEAVVLFAGPVPGLLAALVFFWDRGLFSPDIEGIDFGSVAVVAAIINFANLLPLTPLDGGRLVEIAVFNPWPRARLAFAVLSLVVLLGIAAWFKDPFTLIIVAVLAATLPNQWRLTILHRAWRVGLTKHDQLVHLFETARLNFATMPFPRQYLFIQAVFNQRKVLTPRLWETVSVMVLLIVLWGTGSLTAKSLWSQLTSGP
jgi:Zn-dependent protease